MQQHPPIDSRELVTTSGLAAWWYQKMRGWRVTTINREPRMGLFGRIRYRSKWHLSPPN